MAASNCAKAFAAVFVSCNLHTGLVHCHIHIVVRVVHTVQHACADMYLVDVLRNLHLPIHNTTHGYDMVPRVLTNGWLAKLAMLFKQTQVAAQVMSRYGPIGLCYLMLPRNSDPQDDFKEFVMVDAQSPERLAYSHLRVRGIIGHVFRPVCVKGACLCERRLLIQGEP